MIRKTGLKLQSKSGEERMRSEKVDTVPANKPWEKFYSKEKINGMGVGRIHQGHFLFVLLKTGDIIHVSLLMYMIQMKDGT